jgi:glycosyltransferase involved in cell wall biosynthesis
MLIEEKRPSQSKPTSARGRWFAVILLQYNDHDPFWDRDAGLFFEGFRANGVDSRFVALGKPTVCEERGLILAPQEQMEDPGWWKQWNLEGVVLYSWALPRFTGVAKAIRSAGVTVVLVVDADGGRRPKKPYTRELLVKYIYAKMAGRPFPMAVSIIKTLAAMPKWRHRPTLDHLELVDRIALPSPLGKQRFARYLIDCGRPHLAGRLVLVHHPVQGFMIPDPSVTKQSLILAVGGWERLVKGADLLVKALAAVLEREPSYAARIIGSGERELSKMLIRLPSSVQKRISLTGTLPNRELPAHYQAAQIFLNTSYSESFGIAAAEALCCGGSVVGLAAISSFNYFCSEASGTLASHRTVGAYCDALLTEIEAWRSGHRDPQKISQLWCARVQAPNVASSVLKLLTPNGAPRY